MCDVMCRFQENYESPKYKGKNFTRKEFFKWFKSEYKKTYHSAWSGFNIPSFIFKNHPFKDLTKEESKLISMLPKNKKFYLIATTELKSESIKDILRHELAHSFYYLYTDYKRRINHVVDNKKCICKCGDKLLSMGYCKDVLVDEIQAYIIDGDIGFRKLFLTKDYNNYKMKLNKIFKEYYESI